MLPKVIGTTGPMAYDNGLCKAKTSCDVKDLMYSHVCYRPPHF